LHDDNQPAHTSFFTRNFFYQKQHDCRPPPTLHFSVSPVEDETERQPFWQNRRRCWTSSQNTTSRMHLKMAEALGTVHTRGRGLLQGWWWPIGPKLVFDKMAVPVPEIMDSSLYFVFILVIWRHKSLSDRTCQERETEPHGIVTRYSEVVRVRIHTHSTLHIG
jgi:hypothetical protein